MKTTATHGATVVAASIIHVITIDRVVGGYIQSAGRYNLAVALDESGDSWQGIYECGGDWVTVGADDNDAALDLGAADDTNQTDEDCLRAGADILRAWADMVKRIDPKNSALDDLAEYLIERAAAADAAADEMDAENE